MTGKRSRLFAAAAVSASIVFAGIPANAGEETIAMAVPDLGSSFWISAVYGADQAAKRSGVTLLKLNAGGDNNANQQISQIQDLIQRKVDAIIVGATNGDAVKSVVEDAIKKGIPVVGISSPPNTPELASIISADHYDMGRLQANCLAKAIGGKGEVAMMAGPTGQAWADLRAEGFRDTLKKSFPGVKVVTESRLADNRNSALTTAEDWTTRFPDLSGVYSATDDMAAGVISAFQGAGLDKVKFSASNLSPSAQDLIAKGSLACVSIQEIVAQGQAAFEQAKAAAEKKNVEKQVVLPAVLVDASNLKTVDLSKVVAPSDYRP
jgi:ribose transport system substrate-binding protein/inositol transport system substrate-binding protein